MAKQITFRRGSAAQWSASNPVLALAEPGFETDTKKLKIGDGVTAWNALAYFGAVGGVVIPNPTPVTLSALTLSSSTATEKAAFSATITGKTSGSTITATSSDGTVLTVNGTTVSGTFQNSGSKTITLSETLAGATNTPNASTVALTVAVAPAQDGSIIAANGMRTAPKLLLSTASFDTVPPPIHPDLAMDTVEGDTLVYQWTPDFNLAAGLPDFGGANTRTSFVTLTADPAVPLNVKLAEITAPMGLVAHRAKVQKAPSDASDWCVTTWSGPKTAPSITGSTTYSFPEKQAFVLTIPTDQPTRLGLGGNAASSFERITSATSYLTSHQFRLVGNRVPNYDTGDQSFPLVLTPQNRAGIVGAAIATTVSIINNPADDPSTSGFDPALGEEVYGYSLNNRVITKQADANANQKAVGALSHNSGVRWFETYADTSGALTGELLFGLKDTDTGSYFIIKGNNIYTESGFVGLFGNIDRTKKQMMVVNFDTRRVYYYQEGAPDGRDGGWGAPLGGGWTLPANLINARIAVGIERPIGARAVLNTGQTTPLGGVPAGATQWG